MKKPNLSTLIKDERGASAVEFALVAPILILLFAGIFDVGRAVYVSIPLQEAAHEGAVFASFNPGAPGQTVQRVIESATLIDLDPSNVSVSCPDGIGGDEIAVTVSYDVSFVMPLSQMLLGDIISLVKTVHGTAFSGNTGCAPAG